MRKIWIALPIFLLVVIVLILVWRFSQVTKKAEEEAEEKVFEQIAQESLPYFTMSPRIDGNAIILGASNFSDFDQIDYEVLYKTGALDRGVVGTIVPADTQGTYKNELILGTCSKGVCTYDKDVQFGNLKVELSRGSKNFKFETEFHLQQMAQNGAILTSNDNKLSIDVPKGAVSKNFFVLTHNTGGLAKSLATNQKILSGPYGVFSVAPKLTKKATLTFKFDAEASGAKILAWDADKLSWKELESKAGALGSLTASIDQLTTFVLVSP